MWLEEKFWFFLKILQAMKLLGFIWSNKTYKQTHNIITMKGENIINMCGLQ
jgi:hypothetical protein